MSTTRTLILNHEKIQQKLRRIAYQLYEFNYKEKELVFVAIEPKGVELANRIRPILEEISGISVLMLELRIEKDEPLSDVQIKGDVDRMEGKSVVLIDDVLNSGRTLIYAARHILSYPLKKLSTVVLVDRRHRRYPIKADFVGLTLSTTLQDHIAVEFSEGKDAAYLE